MMGLSDRPAVLRTRKSQRPLPCRTCALPFAYVQGDVLIIESKHSGERHVNVLTAADVRRLLAELEGPSVGA